MPETIAPVFDPELVLAGGVVGAGGALATGTGATATAAGALVLSFSTGTVTVMLLDVVGVSKACDDVSLPGAEASSVCFPGSTAIGKPSAAAASSRVSNLSTSPGTAAPGASAIVT